MGFIALLVGAGFLLLAGVVIFEADYSVSRGFVVLSIMGGVGMVVGLFMLINAGRMIN